MNYEISLPFLEKRTYLHGTTLFNELIKNLPDNAKIDYKIASIIKTDRIFIESFNPNQKSNYNATLFWSSDTEKGCLGVKALKQSKLLKRTDYDEKLISDTVEIIDGKASYTNVHNYSFISSLIPIHKKLLKNNIENKTTGQWLFTKLELNFIPQKYSLIELKLATSIAGGILVKTKIAADKKEAGFIYFSWGNVN